MRGLPCFLLLLFLLPAAAQAQFNYTTGNGSITITRYTGRGGMVAIPGTIKGLPVTSIGDGAFDGCTNLLGGTIPDSVTRIGSGAFANCTSLAGLTIPDSVISIGDGAFWKCTNLTSIVISDSVTSIGKDAFFECAGLFIVTLPNRITSIRDGTFARCTGLSIVSIPGGVTNIGAGAFAFCSSLAEVAIPDGVTSIGEVAFRDCSSLNSVAIPDSVTNIGDGVFYRCASLVSIMIPNRVTRIGELAFSDCFSLVSVTIGNHVTSIGNGAFQFCSSLTSVVIPDSVTRIGDGAFWGCASLASATIGDNVASIGVVGFGNCTSLSSVIIPNSVTRVGERAFIGCTGLTSLTIGNGVTSIGKLAFYGCTRLGSVMIPNGVTSLGERVFYGCASLSSITIPNTVTSIGVAAFEFCSSLTRVTIPVRVTSIGSYAFRYCYSLTEVYFQGNAASLGPSAFDYDDEATIYHVPGTTGWGARFGGRPTAFWYPETDRLLVGVNGAGTLLPNYNNVVLKIGWTYSMTATGMKGHAFSMWLVSANASDFSMVTTPKLTFIMQPGLTVEAVFKDVTRPALTITAPLPWQRITNSTATVRGRASDNAEVAQVLCQINDGDWVTAIGTANWSAGLPLTPGTNRVRVIAVDGTWNVSQTNTVTFFRVIPSQFTLLTNGQGRISRTFTGNTLELGRSYAVTAVPATGQLFSNWTGTVTATNNPLKFLMQSNMVVQANFVPNPYLALKGSYAGLFRLDSPDSLAAINAGSVALSLTERGTFSGSLRLAGAALPFSGRFDLARQATVKVPRTGKAPLWLSLGFASQNIMGRVSADGWTADLVALRRATASSNAFAGRYPMLIMGQHDATETPPGDSACGVTVTASSSISVSGTLADGSVVTLATGHSETGVWPFHASLYGGRGLIIGWLSCETNAAPRNVLWVKPPDAVARYYPGGFREERAVALKRYVPPAPKQTATSWSLGRLFIGGGNLSAPLEAEVLVTNNLIKRLSGSVSNLSLVITNSNGRFGGSFMHPVTRKATPLRGVLVQGLPWVPPAEQVTVGGGSFLGTNEGGWVWLEPKP